MRTDLRLSLFWTEPIASGPAAVLFVPPGRIEKSFRRFLAGLRRTLEASLLTRPSSAAEAVPASQQVDDPSLYLSGGGAWHLPFPSHLRQEGKQRYGSCLRSKEPFGKTREFFLNSLLGRYMVLTSIRADRVLLMAISRWKSQCLVLRVLTQERHLPESFEGCIEEKQVDFPLQISQCHDHELRRTSIVILDRRSLLVFRASVVRSGLGSNDSQNNKGVDFFPVQSSSQSGSVDVGVSSWEKPTVGRKERPLTSVDDGGWATRWDTKGLCEAEEVGIERLKLLVLLSEGSRRRLLLFLRRQTVGSDAVAETLLRSFNFSRPLSMPRRTRAGDIGSGAAGGGMWLLMGDTLTWTAASKAAECVFCLFRGESEFSELGRESSFLKLKLEDFLIVVTVVVVGHDDVLEGPAGRKRLFARRRRDVTVAFLAHAVSVFLPAFLTFGRAEESVEGGLWWPVHVVLRRGCGVVSTDAVHYDRTTTGLSELGFAQSSVESNEMIRWNFVQ
ncbi:hypothetical protein KCU62_g278, partial [Aureobasidium sp. EXF-3399]